MTQSQTSPPEPAAPGPLPAFESPFLRAPEEARTVFLVTLTATCVPLLAGMVFFGWRALTVSGLAIIGCAFFERLYFRVTKAPGLLGRSHAYLTGVLLALTLPPFVPWYVPLIASAFAIIVGKAIFGGVGHFLWQPALVGRLAVAVIFPLTLSSPFPHHPRTWPVLAQDHLLTGDVMGARRVSDDQPWRGTRAPQGADAMLMTPPALLLRGLTSGAEPQYSALANVPEDLPRARPAALTELPPINDFLYGARPGGIGETCAVAILVAGLYLVYRNYVKWQLPLAILLSSCGVLAVAPVYLAGPGGITRMVWWPLLAEGLDTGFVYLCYQVLAGELLLAAFFLAPEMTSRPVMTGGQVIFGIGCGVIGTLLQLYVDVPVPFYMGVLAMNTFTPVIDALWKPRVFGRKWLSLLSRNH